jgi:MFS family permease
VALFGVACGLTIVFYTAFFSTLSFLKGPMRVEDTAAELIVGLGSLSAVAFMVYFGRVSDRVGRKKPIVWGYLASIVLLFPLFWGLGEMANPGLAQATRDNPVVLQGPDCRYDPLADQQGSECGQLMGLLTDRSIPYSAVETPELVMMIGNDPIRLVNEPGSQVNRDAITAGLAASGYSTEKQIPPAFNIVCILALLAVFGALAGATYGPVAAVLTEMFPAKVRYSSMSIPYHIGAGYFGGFLPLIAGYIVARTGDIYAGQWYGFVLLIVAFAVGWWGLKDGPPRDFADDNG